MRPLDPRLLRRSRSARRFLVIGALLALVQAAATIAIAGSLAGLVAGLVAVVGAPGAGTASVSTPPDVPTLAALLVAAAIVRAIAAWAWELVGRSGAARVTAELRSELLVAVASPRSRGREVTASASTADLATVLGPGLDALDDYFGVFLPQLLLTAIAAPLLVAAAWFVDPLSGLILLLVLPVIPLFMALIGRATERVQRRQWESLRSLSRGFLEVVGGLATLTLYGRERRQTERIRAVTDDYRVRTMRVLRVTFLSGFTLELAASLSVALVAVTIGFRLVGGEVALGVGLFVLVIAPEVFLPLRAVGAAFHASAEGVTASGDALDLLERRDGTGDVAPRLATGPWTPHRASHDGPRGLEVRGLAVRRGGVLVVPPLSFRVAPGEVVALAGPSGVGKSSVLAALLGLADADGEIRVEGGLIRPGDRAPFAWSGQSTTLLAGTIASNVVLGDEGELGRLLDEALELAGVELDPSTPLGPGGTGLSGGQSQRVATARAIHRLLARDAPVLLLDEPSSALDEAHEARLASSLRSLAARGHSILVASHRAELLTAADRVVDLAEAARV